MAFCHAARHSTRGDDQRLGAEPEERAETRRRASAATSTSRSTRPIAELHDYLRGWPGLFQKLSDGIKYVREERDKARLDFPIIIKPTVGSQELPVPAGHGWWVKEIGATTLNFQPMDRWTPETYDELWLEEHDQDELRKVVDTMLALKRRGRADHELRSW